MALKPELSIGASLAVGAVVYGIFQTHVPDAASVRHQQPGVINIDKARRTATWTAAAVVGGISLLAKDPTIFIVGGTMTAVMDWTMRHANAVHPETGQLMMNGTGSATPGAYQANATDIVRES